MPTKKAAAKKSEPKAVEPVATADVAKAPLASEAAAGVYRVDLGEALPPQKPAGVE
jgi:hypothetical protein